MNEKFIWIDERRHPEYQKTFCSLFAETTGYNFAVIGFEKEYKFEKKVQKIQLSIFADTKYFLYINDIYTGTGPVCPGGDYGNQAPMPIQYYSNYELADIEKNLKIYAKVQLSPEVQSDMSCGRGGLWVSFTVIYEDDTEEFFETDERWRCRHETAYISCRETDYFREAGQWEQAVCCENIWNLKPSPINNLTEKKVIPNKITRISEREWDVQFDKIYSGYIICECNCEEPHEIEIQVYEVAGKMCGSYKISGKGHLRYQALRLDSIGGLRVNGVSREEIKEIALLYTHYPVVSEGFFRCSDPWLNRIYEVGKHTTEICRQTIELDSPNHQENLGCTGDYFIESLIAYYCFGDTSLSRFDLIRTAEYMRMTNGKMFHTSYSLIWIYMLYDNYLFSGDITVLTETRDVLNTLLSRFHGYVGEKGVIENPPDYMFIDWVPVDEYNLHHPPKALGQASLTAFYYHALCVAAKIYDAMNRKADAGICRDRAENVKAAFNRQFYDSENELYFCGLNDTCEATQWCPANTDKRYYGKHVNTLAALYDLCDNGRELMERVLSDKSLIDVQPYFMHFVLEAIYHVGLFGQYGLQEIYRWKASVEECDKGMKEAWGNFPGYGYDYSHAWAATPTYQLMSKLSGLEIIEPGFKKIRFRPNAFGLEFVEMEIPTPFGKIRCKLGEKTEIEVPDGIVVVE